MANAIGAVVSRGGRPDLAGDASPTLLIVGELDYPVIRMNEEAYAQMRCEKELTINVDRELREVYKHTKGQFSWEDHMIRNKPMAFIALVALIALAVGCDTASNTNTNTNAAISNANTNANVNANANMNTNANRRSVNANISREEYEREKESFAADAKRLGRTIGTGANDGWLWTKTRALLAAADDLRDSTINVDVDNAVVTLLGTVATQAQKTRAAQVAKGVEGVKSVKNNLVVSANP